MEYNNNNNTCNLYDVKPRNVEEIIPKCDRNFFIFIVSYYGLNITEFKILD